MPSHTRKLAAIMVADIVGYSRIMMPASEYPNDP